MKRSRICYEVEVPARGDSARSPKPNGQLDDAPEFVRDVSAKSSRGAGIACRSALCLSTALSRPARRNGKSAISPLEMPVWDPQVCIQCGKCVMVCPHAVIRSKVYEAGAARRRAGDLQVARRAAPGMERLNYTLQVAAEDCTGCGICVDVCPAQEQIGGAAESDQHAAAAAAARNRARELGFLPLHPGAGPAQDLARQRARNAGAAAALRILRRLRRLRRDALHQTADPTFRRPAADRQRHRLLLDLWRQPADHALRARTPRAAARPGQIRSSRTTPSSASASAFRSTSSRSSPANCSAA